MTNTKRRRGIVITAATALCALGSLAVQSAWADEHDSHDRGRDVHRDHGYRDHGYRDHGYQRGRDYGYDHRYYSDGRYRDGGYAPPIVYAPPRPEPGIHVLIPLHIR
jgi:hypothetical protein